MPTRVARVRARVRRAGQRARTRAREAPCPAGRIESSERTL
jgi:hypothetical protein